jgi:hypothetical protein
MTDFFLYEEAYEIFVGVKCAIIKKETLSYWRAPVMVDINSANCSNENLHCGKAHDRDSHSSGKKFLPIYY